jgi:F420-dependent oxidoreductase-like protein
VDAARLRDRLNRGMRFSINIGNFAWPDIASELAAIVGLADEIGLDTVWVGDHLIQANPFSTTEDMLEAYTTLGFIAASSRQVRIGTMVSAVTFRPPALLIKAATTLDVLSGGRAWFGIGAGWHEDEAQAMGLPFPPIAERFERLEDTLRLALRMWSSDQRPFYGSHYRLERPTNKPNAVHRPHTPILIGGAGECKTLRLVARYADACSLYDVPGSPEAITHKLDVLRGHCAAIGRGRTSASKKRSAPGWRPPKPPNSLPGAPPHSPIWVSTI